MGQGHSQLKEELARVTKQLNEAQDQSTALKSANEELKRQVAAGTEATMRAQDQRAATERNCVAEIEAMEGRVHQAVKQREVAEELRRSDALLAKRIMTAQMRRSGEKQVFAHGGFEGSTMAAQLALAAQDELQLRQMLIHTAEQLESTKSLASTLLASDKAGRRRELSKALWGSELGDVSLSIRSEQFQVLGGLRMPRTGAPGKRSYGLMPAVALMRQLGDASGVQTALGGSLLWDARESEVAALKLALCTSPSPSQEYCLSFDQTGGLTGSIQAKREDFTLRLFGTIDLNRKAASRAGAELIYDLD